MTTGTYAVAVTDGTAIDIAVSAVWAAVLAGEITEEEALLHDERLRALRKGSNTRVGDLAATVLESPELVSKTPDSTSSTNRRGRSAYSVAERRERLLQRRALGAGIFPAALITSRFAAPVGAPTVADAAVAAVVAAEHVKGCCMLSIATIAARAFVSERSAQASLRKLQRAGLISIAERRIAAGDNDSNVIRVTDAAWLLHVKEMATVRAIKREGVQKIAPKSRISERNSLSTLLRARDGVRSAINGVDGKGDGLPEEPDGEAERGEGQHEGVADVPLERFLAVGGASLDTRSLALADIRDLRWLRRKGCSDDDIAEAIRQVAAKHAALGWTGRIVSWTYFVPLAIEERDRRRTAEQLACTFNVDGILAAANGTVDRDARGIRDLGGLAELLDLGATEDDIVASIRIVSARRKRGHQAPLVCHWRYFAGAVRHLLAKRPPNSQVGPTPDPT
jgi:hypothetical protein